MKPEEDDLDLHKKILKQIRDSRTHFAEWRDEAKEDYAFYSGEQWDVEDKNMLADQNRPAVTFNRIARSVNAVAGLELQNRQEVRFFPREVSAQDGIVSDVLSDAAKWVRDNCDAEDEESESFTDSLICGMGFTETRLDYENDPEGQVLIERRDPMEMYVDYTAKKRNFDDARYIGRIVDFSEEEFKERWSDAEIPSSLFFDSDNKSDPHIVDPRHYYEEESVRDRQSKVIQVAQHQYFKIETVYPAQNPTNGKIEELSKEQLNVLKKRIPDLVATTTPRRKKVWYQVFLTATDILENEPAPCNMLTFRAITGLRDRNKNVWFGIVRLMKDPQRWANKWMSQIQHILNTQAKSGKVVFETGAVKDPRKFKEEWADPTMPAELNAGGLAKFQQLEAARYPEGTDRLLQYAINAVNDAPGINVELLGLANRQQAGVLEDSRKQAGITILAAFFDGLRRYRKEQGRVLAAFISDYISDGRIIRINGELGPQAIPLLRDKLALKYDVVVDDAPSSPNMKERVYQMLLPVIDNALRAGIPIPPDVLDYIPLPEALTIKWKQYINQQGQDPEIEEKKQIEKAGAMAEIESKQSQAILNKAKAEKELFEIQNPDMPQAQKSMAELELKREQAAAEIQLKREIAAGELAIKQEDVMTKHAVNAESQRMMVDVAKKPTATVQLDTNGAMDAVAEKIGDIVGSINEANQRDTAVLGKAVETMADASLAISQAAVAIGQAIENINKPKIAKSSRDENGNLVAIVETV